MKPRRQERIGSLYRKVISAFLERELRPEKGIVGVTKVELSESGEHLKIYFSVWPDELLPDVLKSLSELENELRRVLAEKVRAKFVPETEFKLDESEKQRFKIEELLKKTK